MKGSPRGVVIEQLLLQSKNFRDVLVRNVQMQKNQLHEQAKVVKEHLVELLKKSDDTEVQFKLLKAIFGPNTFTHLSVKKNMDVIAPICEKLDSDQITKYIQGWLCEMYDSPDLKEFYPDDTQDDEHEDE